MVASICVSIKIYIMLLRKIAAPTKICSIHKSMNQEQGYVPDNKISCLFCCSTICFTLSEVKIHLRFIYTMQTMNSSVLGTRILRIWDRHVNSLVAHTVFLLFNLPHNAPGISSQLQVPHKNHRSQLPFGAKQIPAASESGLSMAVSVSRGISVCSVKKLIIHPFTHLFIHLQAFHEPQAGPGPLHLLWGC